VRLLVRERRHDFDIERKAPDAVDARGDRATEHVAHAKQLECIHDGPQSGDHIIEHTMESPRHMLLRFAQAA
jgi:hypothetical protein